MLIYKLQTSSKITCSEQGQAGFDSSLCIGLVYLVTWLYAILFLHVWREGCLYMSVQSFLLLLLLPSNLSLFQPVSARFYRCAEIMFLGVSGKQAAMWRDPVLEAFCPRACSRSSWDGFRENSCRKQLLSMPQVQEDLTVNHETHICKRPIFTGSHKSSNLPGEWHTH